MVSLFFPSALICVLMNVIQIAGMQVLNSPEKTARFNLTTEFPFYREVLYIPDFKSKKLGKPVVVDREVLNSISCLKTLELKYIDFQCRYTAENSVKFGAPRDTDHPELRQPLALEIWNSISKTLDPGSKMTILTNGPLTSLAKIITETKTASLIQDAYTVGGHISRSSLDNGNVFTMPSNKYAEFHIFLDPFAAKTVVESGLNITRVPLGTQRKVSLFLETLERPKLTRKTPEAQFVKRLLFRLYNLQQTHHRYRHMDTFLGEILGAIFMAEDHQNLKPTMEELHIKVIAEGDASRDGRILIDKQHGKSVKILKNVDHIAYYDLFANRLGDEKQSAVLGSYDEQRIVWNTPPNQT